MTAKPVVKSIAIRGVHFPDLRVDLHPDLTCIIAGRGAGKSTLLNCTRYALGVPPPLHATARAEYVSQVNDNLGDGVATVQVTTASGMHYETRREIGGPPRVRGPGGLLEGVSLTDELFAAEFYGPEEIEVVARDDEARLALIDRFDPLEIRRLSQKIVQCERELTVNAEQRNRLRSEIEGYAASTEELSQIDEALRDVEHVDGADPTALELARADKARRGRERATVVEWQAAMDGIRTGIDALASDVAARTAETTEAGLMEGPRGASLARARGAIDALTATVASTTTHLRDAVTAAETEVKDVERVLAEIHRVEDDRYLALQGLDDRQNERAMRQRALRTHYDELMQIKRRQAERERELQTTGARRRTLLAERARLYEARYQRRDAIAKTLTEQLAPEIKVSMTRGKNREAYLAVVRELSHGGHFKAPFVESLTRSLPPDDLVRAIDADDPQPIMAIDPYPDDQEGRARKLMAHLRASGRLEEIETVELGDVPTIGLKIGKDYRPSTEVSTGQRCVCILPIVLLQPSGPLFLDEPEAHLDNEYVFNVLVRRLVELKRLRQVVVVTHNPNIPVLGEADHVIVLVADGNRGKLAKQGTFDEVKAEIVKLLEGGREALRQRIKRYGDEG